MRERFRAAVKATRHEKDWRFYLTFLWVERKPLLSYTLQAGSRVGKGMV
jgi:hypothetical protein